MNQSISIGQNIHGNNNIQHINFFQNKSFDLLPQDLEPLLDYLCDKSNCDFSKGGHFNVPNLSEKNQRNSVDKDYFEHIKRNVSDFQDIDDIIRNDKSGDLKKKYYNASTILKTSFLSSKEHDIPNFVNRIVAGHKEKTNCNDVTTIKLIELLHYMYSHCDIGIAP